MIKTQELSDPKSCLNKARPDERVFVLLARDECAPDAIRYWAERRIATGKNQPFDPQIIEALECALLMEQALGKGLKS